MDPLDKYRRLLTGAMFRLVISLVALCHSLLEFIKISRLILKREHIFLLWNASFGHTLSSTDKFYRIIYPNRGFTIQIDHARTNPFLSLIYKNSDLYIVKIPKKILLTNKSQYLYGRILYNGLRIYLRLIVAPFPHKYLYDRRQIYTLCNRSDSRLKQGEILEKKLIPYNDLTGWYDLIRNKPIPLDLERDALYSEKAVQLLNKIGQNSFAYLTLRSKNENGQKDDFLRNPGSINNYIKGIEELSKRFGFVLIQCKEKSFEQLNHIENIIYLNSEITNELEFKKAQIIIMSKASILNKPVLVLDGLPYWQGLIFERDMILFKQTIFKGKKLSYDEILKFHSDLTFLIHNENEYKIIDNTTEEIHSTVIEFLNMFDNHMYNQDNYLQLTNLRNDLDPIVLAKYMKNKVSNCNF